MLYFIFISGWGETMQSRRSQVAIIRARDRRTGGGALPASRRRGGFRPRVRRRVGLGVGINLLPHSVRILTDLGLADQLDAIAVRTAQLAYYNKFGQRI